MEGDGFERQNEKINQFCVAHKLDAIGYFQEEGVSGTTEGLLRPSFSAMVRSIDEQAIIRNNIGAIVVERMDRLARDLMVSEVLLSECRKRNVQVFAADQGSLIDMASDSGDPTRILIRQIMGALAQWEKSMLVAKLSAAKQRIREATGRCEGRKPFGSTPDEAVSIRMIRDYCETADYVSYQSLAQYLNENGRTQRNGSPWNWRSARRMCERLNKKGLI